MVIWGNHSPTMFPNFEGATFEGKSVVETVNDTEWFRKDFINRVCKRGSEILKAKGFTAVFPAGKALCDHLYDWYHGT